MSHLNGVCDLRMKYETITSIRQRFAVRRNNGRAGPLVQPRVRGSDACLQSEAVDRHRTLIWRHGEIDQQRRAAFSTKHLVKSHDPAVARDELVTGLFSKSFEDGI